MIPAKESMFCHTFWHHLCYSNYPERKQSK